MIVSDCAFTQYSYISGSTKENLIKTTSCNRVLNLQRKSSPTKKPNLASLVETIKSDFFDSVTLLSPQKKNHKKNIKSKTDSLKSHHQNIIKSSLSKHMHSSQIIDSHVCKLEQISQKSKKISLFKGETLFEEKLKILAEKSQNASAKKLQVQKLAGHTEPCREVVEKTLDSLGSQFQIQITTSLNQLQKCLEYSQVSLESKNQFTVKQNNEENSQILEKGKASPLSIDDFQEIKMLGAGCYGRVSLMRHKKTNSLVAIKKILKSSLAHEDSTYLARQIQIQSQSLHPNIVQLYGFFHDSQNIYLILQPCNQGNLYSLMLNSAGKISQDKTKRYIKQVVSALNYLHSRDIIHRDLKPQNILLQNGLAKICDFGWAVHAPEMRSTLCGTPIYSSPEIAKGEKYDLKLDIWNIGVMTYELICGRIPFQIRSHDDIQKVIVDEVEYPENGEMSPECINFIKGCLEKNPKDRFEAWQLIQHPFLRMREKEV